MYKAWCEVNPQSAPHMVSTNGSGDQSLENLGPHLIGRRIAVDETHFGTIQFTGSISNVPGVWLGIDWDQAERGKHDGSHDGVHYFDTTHPTSGSFVRSNKVSLGMSLEEAVASRYCFEESVLADLDTKDIFEDNAGRSVAIEVVGARKVSAIQNQLDQLTAVNLHGAPVYGCRPGINLNTLLPNLTELSLASTLISSWTEIAKVCIQLPVLSNLNLSENRLQFPVESSHSTKDGSTNQTEDFDLLQRAFHNVAYLVLVRLDYSWKEFVVVLSWFPQLRHLCLAYNRIRAVTNLPKQLNELTYLDIANNSIEDFRAGVLPLGDLPRLETLLLHSNALTEVSFPGNPFSSSEVFPELTTIGLSGNRLKTWNSLDQLNRLGNLRHVTILDNPLLEDVGSKETARQLIIARMRRLKTLNRNLVTHEDRRGAEIDYLKRFGKDWLDAGGNQDPGQSRPNEAFRLDHPRYGELVEKFGPPENSELKVFSQSLKQGLLKVTIMCPDKTNVEKSLPGRMTVQHLRALVRRIFKLAGSQAIALFYTSTKQPGVEFELDCETREVGFYNMESGDTLLVKLV